MVTRRYYDGQKPTGHHLRDVLPRVLKGIAKQVDEDPSAVLAAWPHIVGPAVAPMTQAVAFIDGLLTVKVSDSTLYSLLRQHERLQLLKSLRNRFPQTNIKNIVFRIG